MVALGEEEEKEKNCGASHSHRGTKLAAASIRSRDLWNVNQACHFLFRDVWGASDA
jgi:hypothetical protein